MTDWQPGEDEQVGEREALVQFETSGMEEGWRAVWRVDFVGGGGKGWAGVFVVG